MKIKCRQAHMHVLLLWLLRPGRTRQKRLLAYEYMHVKAHWEHARGGRSGGVWAEAIGVLLIHS